jgi:hypothetical protein
MNTFKFFEGMFNYESIDFEPLRLLTSIFAQNLIDSGEYETTIYPKQYCFPQYSLYVQSISEGIKINDDAFMPYVETYRNVIITYVSLDETIQTTYQFRI